jgi:lipopolysaccharide exporter
MALSELGSKILSGSFWTVLMRWSSRLLGVVSVIILARVLLPEDYGLVAQAVLFSGVLELMTQFGFATALIRNKNATEAQYHTVWTLSLLRGLFLSLLIFGAAGFVSDFFSEPRIYPMILVYALVIFINGFLNVGVVDFQRKMQFDKDFILNMSSRVTAFVVTLTIAMLYRSYWAFPLGTLAGAIVKLAVSYKMSDFKPKLSLNEFQSIFHFSKWFFLYESFSAISTKLDTFLLSKWGSAEELGLYTVSYEISGMPSTEIAMPVARASLPALALKADNIEEFRSLYTQILISILFIAVPACVGLSVLADHIVLLMLGATWAGAALFIKVLAFIGISRVNVACAVSALAAVGKADLLGRYSMIMLVIKALAMVAGMYWQGAFGLAVGALVASIVGMALIHYLQSRLSLVSFSGLWNGLWRVVVSSVVMWSSLYVFSHSPIIANFSSLFTTIALVLLGVIIYCTVLNLLCFIQRWPDGPEKQTWQLIKARLVKKHD